MRSALLAFLLSSFVAAQPGNDASIWRDSMDWAAARNDIPATLEQYRAALVARGVPANDADARVARIPKLYESNADHRREAMTLRFNQLYRTPGQTRFTIQPNEFLVAVTKDLKPGKALDVAMGQGRNAVYLASQGWDVTGFDLAEEGLKIAAANAGRIGARIHTIKSAFEDFDYGAGQWDLIYFVYTDAPVVDPKYVQRIVAALKPGGLLVIDRPFRSLTDPEPGWVEEEHDRVNAIVKAWTALQIVHYEDKPGIAEWQQTSIDRLKKQHRIVRLLARKL